MGKHIHHLGICVRDLDKAIRFYQDTLGLELAERVSWPGIEAALLPFGEIILELIEPMAIEIPIAESLMRLLEDQGGGIHHMCIEVDDIDGMTEALKIRGVRLMTTEPQDTPGGRIIWLEEKTTNGYMIELCEQGYKIVSG